MKSHLFILKKKKKKDENNITGRIHAYTIYCSYENVRILPLPVFLSPARAQIF
jgi:hypothetical protein